MGQRSVIESVCVRFERGGRAFEGSAKLRGARVAAAYAPPLAVPDTWGPSWLRAHVQPLLLVHVHTFPLLHTTVHTAPAWEGRRRRGKGSGRRGGGASVQFRWRLQNGGAAGGAPFATASSELIFFPTAIV